jgi:hypothetical protein
MDDNLADMLSTASNMTDNFEAIAYLLPFFLPGNNPVSASAPCSTHAM